MAARAVFAMAVAMIIFGSTADAATIKCSEMQKYRQEVAKILLEHEDTYEALGEVSESENGLLTMTPRELETLGKGLLDVADDLEDYTPPASAKPYHKAFTESMALLGNFFLTAADAGVMTSAVLYADAIEKSDTEFDRRTADVERACPNWTDN